MEFNERVGSPGSASGGRWQPMRRGAINPQAQAMLRQIGEDEMDEVWTNDAYEVQVRYMNRDEGRKGALHLSIKLLTRKVIHDWRHLQSIKNEVAGPEREAVELYPAESRLVDTSNQFHLWVMPHGLEVPIGFTERAVGTDADMFKMCADRGIPVTAVSKARQRPWQPGLATGPKR